MSDAERRALGRRAGDGDLSAALDLVNALMRGFVPKNPLERMSHVDRLQFERTETAGLLGALAHELRGVAIAIRAGDYVGSSYLAEHLDEIADRVEQARISPVEVIAERPPTGEDLASMKRISMREVFMGEARYPHPDPRDTLVRWLIAHRGKVIDVYEDPSSFEAIEPKDHVKKLEKWVESLNKTLWDWQR